MGHTDQHKDPTQTVENITDKSQQTGFMAKTQVVSGTVSERGYKSKYTSQGTWVMFDCI